MMLRDPARGLPVASGRSLGAEAIARRIGEERPLAASPLLGMGGALRLNLDAAFEAIITPAVDTQPISITEDHQ